MEIRTFNPVTGVVSAQFIDVSNFQGNFDWAGAKRQVGAPLVAGMFRLTQGLGAPGTNSPDPFAAHNHAAIRDAGLYRGAYHCLDPRLPGDKQADYFVTEHGKLGLVGSNILACDNETAGASPTQVADCAGLFMETLAKLRPHNPNWVYSYYSFIQEGNCSGLGRYDLWLADDTSNAPRPPAVWMNWTGWQWGERPAGGQNVDADAFNGTVADFGAYIAKFAGPPPATKIGAFYAHTFDGRTPVWQIAKSRNETSETFLLAQAAHFSSLLDGPDAQAALTALGVHGRDVPAAGAVWLSVNP